MLISYRSTVKIELKMYCFRFIKANLKILTGVCNQCAESKNYLTVTFYLDNNVKCQNNLTCISRYQ